MPSYLQSFSLTLLLKDILFPLLALSPSWLLSLTMGLWLWPLPATGLERCRCRWHATLVGSKVPAPPPAASCPAAAGLRPDLIAKPSLHTACSGLSIWSLGLDLQGLVVYRWYCSLKAGPGVGYDFPLPIQAWLFKNFLQNLNPRSEGHLTPGQREKKHTTQDTTLCFKTAKIKTFCTPRRVNSLNIVKLYKTKIHKESKTTWRQHLQSSYRCLIFIGFYLMFSRLQILIIFCN